MKPTKAELYHMKIATTDNGYAKHSRCGLNHGGNHGLVAMDQRQNYWQCQGCGYIATREQVADPKGDDIGVGGVIRA